MLLDGLVLRSTLIISDALDGDDALLLSQEDGMQRRVWHPDEDKNPDDNGQSASQEVHYLVRCDRGIGVERYTLQAGSEDIKGHCNCGVHRQRIRQIYRKLRSGTFGQR